MARQVRPSGELHPLPLTVIGPTDDFRKSDREDALTSQDTPECAARRSLRATTARLEITVDVTPEFIFSLLFLSVVENSDVDDFSELLQRSDGYILWCSFSRTEAVLVTPDMDCR